MIARSNKVALLCVNLVGLFIICVRPTDSNNLFKALQLGESVTVISILKSPVQKTSPRWDIFYLWYFRMIQ